MIDKIVWNLFFYIPKTASEEVAFETDMIQKSLQRIF